jgi:spore coat protein SA
VDSSQVRTSRTAAAPTFAQKGRGNVFRRRRTEQNDLSALVALRDRESILSSYEEFSALCRILTISPGVLPLPPVLGGAVENLIARLHTAAADQFEMEYVSVRPPREHESSDDSMARAQFHYLDSIDPLSDFTFDNQFELHESSKWGAYLEHCVHVARSRRPGIVHIHNEAQLVAPLREILPNASIILHINDQVVTRCGMDELRALGRACNLILACSGYIGREIESAFVAAKIDMPRLEVFYNFVDAREYDPAAVDPRRIEKLRGELQINGPVLLFVGRMIEQKGPHLAMRAFRKVLKAVPAARLVCVGAPWYSRNNQSSFVDAVRAEFADLEQQVRFTGYVRHRDMPLYYALADVVCAPSVWDDPSPFVTYEAQAMARPIVTSRRGGIPEIVADHVTGRCIDVFDTVQFADTVIRWFNEPALAHRVGAQGRARILEQFELRRSQEQILATYRRCLNSQADRKN